jgi:tetratricopeptide (TPR) repeat protein
MRNSWLKTTTALICLAGFASTAAASPALMAAHGRGAASKESSSIWPWSKAKPAAAAPAMPPVVGRPAEETSHNPVQYLKSAAAKLPFGSKNKSASAQRGMQPAAQQKPDAISLSTPIPTGPPSPEFFIFAAQTCERQNDIPQARNNYQRALNLWPGQVEVLRAAARMEDRQGNLPLAENLYGQAVASNPQHAGALNDLGLCLARQGKLDASLQVLEQAVQLQPTKALYRNNVATVLVEMRQDQKALAHLAAVHSPADANFNLGQLLVERNRAADAEPYFQAALQLSPGMVQAQEALAKLRGSKIAVSTPMVGTPATPVSPFTPRVAQQMPTAAPQQTQAAIPQYAAQPAVPQQTFPPAVAQQNAMSQQSIPQNVVQQTAPTVPTANYPAATTTQPRYLPPVASRPGATGTFQR